MNFQISDDDVQESIGLFREESHDDQHDIYIHTSSQESCAPFIYHPFTVPSKRLAHELCR